MCLRVCANFSDGRNNTYKRKSFPKQQQKQTENKQTKTKQPPKTSSAWSTVNNLYSPITLFLL